MPRQSTEWKVAIRGLPSPRGRRQQLAEEQAPADRDRPGSTRPRRAATRAPAAAASMTNAARSATLPTAHTPGTLVRPVASVLTQVAAGVRSVSTPRDAKTASLAT